MMFERGNLSYSLRLHGQDQEKKNSEAKAVAAQSGPRKWNKRAHQESGPRETLVAP